MNNHHSLIAETRTQKSGRPRLLDGSHLKSRQKCVKLQTKKKTWWYKRKSKDTLSLSKKGEMQRKSQPMAEKTRHSQITLQVECCGQSCQSDQLAFSFVISGSSFFFFFFSTLFLILLSFLCLVPLPQNNNILNSLLCWVNEKPKETDHGEKGLFVGDN